MSKRKPRRVKKTLSVLNGNCKGGTITVRVTQDLHLRFRREAKRQRRPMSEFLVEMIEAFVFESENQP